MSITLPPLRLVCQGHRLPKNGNTHEECEDAWAADTRIGRFAVADGASEGAFSGEWARILVNGFLSRAPTWPQFLEGARQRWLSGFDGQTFPWYVEEKFRTGAFASFCGVGFHPTPFRSTWSWKARAVGDSCLFLVREGQLVTAFPMRESSAFGTLPALVCSRPDTRAFARPLRASGDWQPGDRLFLMTDALAQWFLREVEQGRTPWNSWEATGHNGNFAAWVEARRSRADLRNDDIALVRIQEAM